MTGPNGFAARAKVIALDTGPTADSAVATYQVDGIAFTSRYTLSVFDAPIAQVTLFYLRPQQWE